MFYNTLVSQSVTFLFHFIWKKGASIFGLHSQTDYFCTRFTREVKRV